MFDLLGDQKLFFLGWYTLFILLGLVTSFFFWDMNEMVYRGLLYTLVH